ncbi:MAG: hypothetical protein ACI4DY_07885, partial [Monoglobaceae bacterium]
EDESGNVSYEISGINKRAFEYMKASPFESLLCLQASNAKYTGDYWAVPVDEKALEAWYNYCYNLALQTKDFVTYYEVWNEPNTPTFNTNDASYEQYTELVRRAYNAIKLANPNAKIVAPATSGCGVEYIEELLKCGVGEYIDVYSIHPYTFDGSIDHMKSPEKGGMFEETYRLREVLNNYGQSSKPIWFSEVGYTDVIGIEKQTAYTVRMLILNEVFNYADVINIYRYADTNTSSERFGLIDLNGKDSEFTAKPVFSAVSNFMDLITNSSYVETLDYGEDVSVYRFKTNDNKDLLAFWTEDEERAIALNLGTDSVTLIDTFGNETSLNGINNVFTLHASKTPSYIVGDFNCILKAEAKFGFDKYSLQITKGETKKVTIQSSADDAFELLVETPSVLTSVNAGIDGTQAEIGITAFGQPKGSICFTVKKGNEIYYKGTVKVLNTLKGLETLAEDDFESYSSMLGNPGDHVQYPGYSWSYIDSKTIKRVGFQYTNYQLGAAITDDRKMRVVASYGTANKTLDAGFKICCGDEKVNSGILTLDFDMALQKEVTPSILGDTHIAIYVDTDKDSDEDMSNNTMILKFDGQNIFFNNNGEMTKSEFKTTPNNLNDFEHYHLVFDFNTQRIMVYAENQFTAEFAMPNEIIDYGGIDSIAFVGRKGATVSGYENIGINEALFDNLKVMHGNGVCEFSNVEILQNGKSISSFEDLTENCGIQVNTTINNTANSDKSMNLIYAVYKDNTLVNVLVQEAVLTPGVYDAQFKSDYIEIGDLDGLKIKAFLWDSEYVTPITINYEL